MTSEFAFVLGTAIAASQLPPPAWPVALLAAQELALAVALWEKGVRLATQAQLYVMLSEPREAAAAG